MHDKGARGFTGSIDEIELERTHELMDAIEQVESNLIDRFEVQPITAQRAIRALSAYLPREHKKPVPEPARAPYKRAAG